MIATLRAGVIGAAAVTGAVYLSLALSHTNPTLETLPAPAIRVLSALPHSTISAVCGAVAHFPVPSPLRSRVYQYYTPHANEAALPLDHYPSLAAFFARELKPNARPVSACATLISPADATLVEACPLGPGGALPSKVKGVFYTLRDLINADEREPIVNSDHLTLYAAILHIEPTDCHRFCSPTDWFVNFYRHTPGQLQWLNWNYSQYSPYTTNERVSVIGTWSHGFFSLTAVGACGIGSIVLDHESSPQSDTSSMARGQSMGGFRLGSAIVLVFEAPHNFQFAVQNGHRVKAGEPLGFLPSESLSSLVEPQQKKQCEKRNPSPNKTTHGMRVRRSW